VLATRPHAATLALGGTAFIPFKSSSVEPKGDSVWSKMYHYFMFNREEFLAHHHKRSNVETAFAMIKGKFGASVKSKSAWEQVNEVLCKVLCHNICVVIRAMHELGIEPEFGSMKSFGSETDLEPKLALH
jgi:transposase